MSKRPSVTEIEDVQEPKRMNQAFEKPLNMLDWIDNNKESFLPPVCNKLMYGGQLKVMFVGGPNSRKDYHIEEGEELFYQIKGDMILKVIEKDVPKEFVIKEGEIFRLPSRIHHSPQRLENTVGLVIERERVKDEFDGIRYFCEDGVSVLWEKWFQCEDLGKEIAPVINEYFASEPCKTGVPDPENIWKEPPLKVDNKTELKPPFSLKQWLKDNKNDYEHGKMTVTEEKEFKVHVHGAGEEEGSCEGDIWLWQMEGDASVTVDDITRQMGKNDVIIIPSGSKYKIKRKDQSIGLSVSMDPNAAKN